MLQQKTFKGSTGTRRPPAIRRLPMDKKNFDADVWIRHQDEIISVQSNLQAEPYPPEDALTDALCALPTAFMAKRLIELLRPKEIREFAEGMIVDCSEAARTLKPLEYANAINSWVATAEEMIANRKTQRFILAARDKADAFIKQTGAAS